MSQVTIYLEDEIESKLKQAAKAKHTSVSKWVGDLIKEKITDEWPESVKTLAGAWDDFPDLKDIRAGYSGDIKREEF